MARVESLTPLCIMVQVMSDDSESASGCFCCGTSRRHASLTTSAPDGRYICTVFSNLWPKTSRIEYRQQIHVSSMGHIEETRRMCWTRWSCFARIIDRQRALANSVKRKLRLGRISDCTNGTILYPRYFHTYPPKSHNSGNPTKLKSRSGRALLMGEEIA